MQGMHLCVQLRSDSSGADGQSELQRPDQTLRGSTWQILPLVTPDPAAHDPWKHANGGLKTYQVYLFGLETTDFNTLKGGSTLPQRALYRTQK